MMFIRKKRLKKILEEKLLFERQEYCKYTKLKSEAILTKNEFAYKSFSLKFEAHLSRALLIDEIMDELGLKEG